MGGLLRTPKVQIPTPAPVAAAASAPAADADAADAARRRRGLAGTSPPPTAALPTMRGPPQPARPC